MSKRNTRNRRGFGPTRGHRRLGSRRTITGLIVVAVAAWAILKGFVWVISPFYNDRWETCTVTDKDRTSTSREGHSDSRIYTKQCGVLVNKDMWARGKTESADVYGQIEPGRTYRMHVVGPRLGVVSAFPNVLEAEPVKK